MTEKYELLKTYNCEQCGGYMTKIVSQTEINDRMVDIYKCKSCGRMIYK